MTNRDLSIIIVNYNTTELTENCINSVILNTHGIEYEIILVDNSSKDGSCAYLKEVFPNIQIIANSGNLGFAKANNQGIRLAKGRNILLLNSDTIVLDDCLKKVLEFAETRHDVGVVGCKILNKDGSLQYSCYHSPGFLSELVFFTKDIIKGFWDPIAYYKYMKYWNHNSIKVVDCISGCFMMIKKEVFSQVEHLDEKYFMYYEDSDFCRRVKDSGLKVLYYPNSQIIHLQGLSGDKTSFSTLKQCFDSAYFFINKHYGRFASKVFRSLCVLIWKIEQLIFSFFMINKKCAQKAKMLRSLIG
ncbi:MAG: glycosyltransferase family 2 protein [Candidatus Omnitrophica bacterium]|nr:glycosyltransferase family 2 protein [Candidatus Omnitrophota bacterium]